MTRPDANFESTDPRPCGYCKGSGTRENVLFKYRPNQPEQIPCRNCKGVGTFPALDIQAILDEVFTKRGKKRTFRKSYAAAPGYENLVKARAYYVWRLARFHGGADVTMPFTATTLSAFDPFVPELDALADVVAKVVFKTNMAAAYRWGNALGGSYNVPEGLPATAYPCGPVADAAKPAFEALELL